jgi:hypothetical protein
MSCAENIPSAPLQADREEEIDLGAVDRHSAKARTDRHANPMDGKSSDRE